MLREIFLPLYAAVMVGATPQQIDTLEQANAMIESALKEGATYGVCLPDNTVRLGSGNQESAHDVVIAAKQHCDFGQTRKVLLAALASG